MHFLYFILIFQEKLKILEFFFKFYKKFKYACCTNIFLKESINIKALFIEYKINKRNSL